MQQAHFWGTSSPELSENVLSGTFPLIQSGSGPTGYTALPDFVDPPIDVSFAAFKDGGTNAFAFGTDYAVYSGQQTNLNITLGAAFSNKVVFIYFVCSADDIVLSQFSWLTTGTAVGQLIVDEPSNGIMNDASLDTQPPTYDTVRNSTITPFLAPTPGQVVFSTYLRIGEFSGPIFDQPGNAVNGVTCSVRFNFPPGGVFRVLGHIYAFPINSGWY